MLLSDADIQNGGHSYGVGLNSEQQLASRDSMAEQDRKFLKFRWDQELYQFKLCPFGLGSAPRMFLNLSKPVMAVLGKNAVQVVIFLDDMVFIDHDKVILESHIATSIDLLE